jgi:Lrp/AsnC family transcriptional regulator, regulator for asnA, asnC and gidA
MQLDFCDTRRIVPASPRFDDLDLQIIDALSEDGRRPFTSVAEDLGVAEATVRSRVSRLQRIDAIRFVTDTRPHELGYLFAYLGVRIGGPDVRSAVDALCEIPEAVYVIECAGHYDVLVEVIAKDSDDLLRLMHTEVRGVPGVTEVDTFMGLRIAKGTFRYTDLGRAGEAHR